VIAPAISPAIPQMLRRKDTRNGNSRARPNETAGVACENYANISSFLTTKFDDKDEIRLHSDNDSGGESIDNEGVP
jgi:hypothetical protein